MKRLVTALTVAMLAATPALAAGYRSTGIGTGSYAYSDDFSSVDTGYGYDAYASADIGTAEPVGPYGVYSFGRYAGWDPDPAVRLSLMKDPGLLGAY